MLEILVAGGELYNEQEQSFYYVKPSSLILEHSLLSISKWESIWRKPFLSSEKKSEEVLDYIRCMTINKVDSSVYSRLSTSNVETITAYIENPMTATTIKHFSKTHKKEIMTSEVIYYYMIALGIPFECEKWHLNRLLTLIDVCSIKGSNPKKMSKQAIAQQNMALNAARRAKYNTKG